MTLMETMESGLRQPTISRHCLTGVWSFTAAGGPTGLEVTQAGLIPPDQPAAEANGR